MCLIHNNRLLLMTLTLGALAAAGCQSIVPPRAAAPVNDPPAVADPAIPMREWEQKTSYYANGATIAGGTAYMWQVHETVPPGARRLVEVPVATANIVSTPVGVFVNSPFEKQVIRGESVPPTYTANPALP